MFRQLTAPRSKLIGKRRHNIGNNVFNKGIAVKMLRMTSPLSPIFGLPLTILLTSFGCGKDHMAAHKATQEVSAAMALAAASPLPPTLSIKDYVHMWWPQRYASGSISIQSGYYGLTFDPVSGSITHLGYTRSPVSQTNAAVQANGVVEALPVSSSSMEIATSAGTFVANKFADDGGGVVNPSRIIDSGTFMQRVELNNAYFASATNVKGNVTIAAQPRQFVVNSSATATTDIATSVQLTFRLNLVGGVAKFTKGTDSRSVILQRSGSSGDTVTFATPETASQGVTIAFSSSGVVFTKKVPNLASGQTLSLPVLVIPANLGSATAADEFLTPLSTAAVAKAQVPYPKVTTTAITTDPNAVLPPYTDATYDYSRALNVIGLSPLPISGGWSLINNQNVYNRVRFKVTNPSSQPRLVPIAFDDPASTAAGNVSGGSPMIRDLAGEPVGIPVQISKNWHATGQKWYHFYTIIPVAASSSVEYEFTLAGPRWGKVFAASHSQLSLVGWAGNQLWDESAMGSFGESITYDPHQSAAGSNICDVRPMLVQANNSKWNWAGNVGGGDFLVYFNSSNQRQPLSRMKVDRSYTGPNLTKVTYAAESLDKKVDVQVTAQMGRTDDVVRTWDHLKYKFLADTTYTRLAIFQALADGYSEGRFKQHAYGDETGVKFQGAFPSPLVTGYLSAKERGILSTGKAPWFMLYGATAKAGESLPSQFANVMYTVRSYKATINGATYTQPNLSIVGINNNGYHIGFEIGFPYNSSQMLIKAGSIVEATIEYAVPPADKSVYYGSSDYLLAMPATDFNTPAMAIKQARDNMLTVTPSIGTLNRTYPIEITAAGATGVVAQFSLSGGLGYTPVTFHGLPSYNSWALERKVGTTWARVDQSVIGNDYWQSYYSAAQGNYDLIFNINNSGLNEYRLVK